LVESLPAEGELFIAGTVGEQPEVTDAHEAIGQDVQQEAADELSGWRRTGGSGWCRRTRFSGCNA
jgi:hypothetical protein